MKRYFNSELATHTTLWDTEPKEVHISFAGQRLGSHCFLGQLVHDLGPQGLEQLCDTPAVIYIDDILDVDPDCILNPGFVAEFVRDVIKNASPLWDVILTKSIERDI